MKKIILLICCLIVTGCSSAYEINNLSVVKNMYIDYDSDEYKVKMQIIDTAIDSNEKSVVIEENAHNIDEVFERLQAKFKKIIYISHMEALVVSQNIVDEKLEEVIEYFLKNNEARNNFDVIIGSFNENSSDTDLKEFIKNVRVTSGSTMEITMEELTRNMKERQESFLPLLKIDDENFETDGILLIKNFQKNEKVDGDDVKLINLVLNKIEKTRIDSIQCISSNSSITQNRNNININITTVIDGNKDLFKEIIEKRIKEMWNKYSDLGFNIFMIRDDLADLKLSVKVKVVEY